MPGFDLSQVAAGALLALIIASLAYALRALSLSGAVAAFCLGTIIFGLGGFSWAVLLLTFFIPSSGLSFLFRKRKSDVEAVYEKGSRRDAWQVVANGGIAGLAVLVHSIAPASLLPWLGASAALAAASADTWATELGTFSRRDPILIASGKRVRRGTSGGISFTGEIAALTGALVIALISAFFLTGNSLEYPGSFSFEWVALVTLSGFIGSQVDSLLGATVQVNYYCPVCQTETEKHPLHSCGSQTVYLRGIRWITNDWVNLFCTLSGVLFAFVAAFLFKV